jgi:hypothetical protein
MADTPRLTMTVIVLNREPIAICETTAQVAAFFKAHRDESVDYETFVVPCFYATELKNPPPPPEDTGGIVRKPSRLW